MHNLQLLLSDSSVAVQKRVIQSLTQLYKITLQWLARANSVSDLMQKTWQVKAKNLFYISNCSNNKVVNLYFHTV